MADSLASFFLPETAPVPAPRPPLGNAAFPMRPFDPARDQPRQNPDGSISTEVLRTVPVGDQWVNVPSLWFRDKGGYVDLDPMNDDVLGRLASMYEAQTGGAFPRFGSLDEAVRAAVERSAGGGAVQGGLFGGR